MIRRCRTCNLVKTRNKVCNGFVDSRGKRWHAFQCPTCYNMERKVMGISTRKLDKRRSDEETVTFDESYEKVPVYHKEKKCRKCEGLLELSRYFSCLKCIPEMETDTYDDYMYEGTELKCKISDMAIIC